MDKRFVKKNILLFIILGASCCVVITLGGMIIFEHAAMQRSITETQEMVSIIDKLNSQRPAPVRGNDQYIKEDIDQYKVKVPEIQRYFGQPFFDAKMAFVKTLLAGLKNDSGEELSDAEKLERFKQALNTFWETDQMRTARDQIYISFKLKSKELLKVDFKDYEKRWDDAIRIFTEEAAKRTHEDLKENLYDIFLMAFGFKRTLSLQPEKYEAFANNSRGRLIDYYNNQKKVSFYLASSLQDDSASSEFDSGNSGRRGRRVQDKGVIGGSGSTFGFPQTEKIPRPQIPNYVFCWTIVNDLAYRIADSGVIALTEFTENIVEPVVEGNYRYYRFQFTVAGNMNSIRQLMTNLNRAYEDRRVYIVHDIELELKTDTLKELLNAETMALIMGSEAEGEAAEVIGGQPTSQVPPPPHGGKGIYHRDRRNPGGPPLQEMSKEEQAQLERQREADLEKAKPFYERKNYGRVFFGGDIVPVLAKFTVDYVVYVTEEMK